MTHSFLGKLLREEAVFFAFLGQVDWGPKGLKPITADV
jgi:hypothetical protein